MKPIFYVYAGPGADLTFMEPALRQEAARHGGDCQRIMPDDIRAGALDNPSAVFLSLPGARSGQVYQESLGPIGANALRRAVENGMALDGTCAGGYILARDINYRKEIPGHERNPATALGFFNATAYGELPLLRPHNGTLLEGWHRANATTITFGHTSAKVFYWGGGMLLPHGRRPDLKVIARYESLPSEPIAMAAQPFGRGMVVFSGIHPEVTGAALLETPQVERFDPDDGTWRKNIAAQLQQHEVSRQMLWDSKMQWALTAGRARKLRLSGPTLPSPAHA